MHWDMRLEVFLLLWSNPREKGRASLTRVKNKTLWPNWWHTVMFASLIWMRNDYMRSYSRLKSWNLWSDHCGDDNASKMLHLHILNEMIYDSEEKTNPIVSSSLIPPLDREFIAELAYIPPRMNWMLSNILGKSWKAIYNAGW